ncbi:MAG: orotidine-5'-phosphate decarboxylase [Bacillota bacterium]|nr:orotidine-5'-phosphate decarboxylase [Bacillota bacterium]
MMNFADRLHDAILKTENPTVMGLDPQLDFVPEALLSAFREACDDAGLATGLAISEFNRRLLDAVAGVIPAVKLQSAFYEQYGLPGLDALQQTIAYARNKGFLVIVDAKRNDIGSTAAAYARTFLNEAVLIDGTKRAAFAADAVTLNAYLGIDGIQPFLDCCGQGKGVFILVRTSNPSAGDLQDLELADGHSVCEAMADLVSVWGKNLIGKSGYSSVGAVVGATWPQQAESLRRRMPHTFILVPGYGAQGGTADDAVRGFGQDGRGGIVNASRSLMAAWKKHGMDHDLFDLAARKEALSMRKALQKALEQFV